MNDEEKRPLIEYGVEISWDGGMSRSTTYHLRDMEESGIEDCWAFIQGYKDALTDNGFNDSHPDYIKGFKYFVTHNKDKHGR